MKTCGRHKQQGQINIRDKLSASSPKNARIGSFLRTALDAMNGTYREALLAWGRRRRRSRSTFEDLAVTSIVHTTFPSWVNLDSHAPKVQI